MFSAEQKFATDSDYIEHVDQVDDEMGIEVSFWYGPNYGADLWTEHGFGDVDTLLYETCSENGTFKTEVKVKGKRWADLWKAADLAIKESGDFDKVAVRWFEVIDRKGVIELHTS